MSNIPCALRAGVIACQPSYEKQIWHTLISGASTCKHFSRLNHVPQDFSVRHVSLLDAKCAAISFEVRHSSMSSAMQVERNSRIFCFKQFSPPESMADNVARFGEDDAKNLLNFLFLT